MIVLLVYSQSVSSYRHLISYCFTLRYSGLNRDEINDIFYLCERVMSQNISDTLYYNHHILYIHISVSMCISLLK